MISDYDLHLLIGSHAKKSILAAIFDASHTAEADIAFIALFSPEHSEELKSSSAFAPILSSLQCCKKVPVHRSHYPISSHENA